MACVTIPTCPCGPHDVVSAEAAIGQDLAFEAAENQAVDDGAAPSATTNMIAAPLISNSRMAKGNHSIDGMVCNPVFIEPTATRIDHERVTAMPTAPPITSENPKPIMACRMVCLTARHSSAVNRSFRSTAPTSAGEGST